MISKMLTFEVTNECNVRCAHCLMDCVTEGGARLSLSQIMRTVDEVVGEEGMNLFVVLSGGEPTLLGDDLLEILASLSVRGIPTRMVSNASWASSPDEAARVIKRLREAGLTELNLSMDDFHAVWVPVQNVLNAWRASHGVGFGSVAIAVAEGPKSRVTCESVKELLGEEVPVAPVGDELSTAPSSDGTVYVIGRGKYSRLGRGRHLKNSIVELRAGFPNGPCDKIRAGSVITSENRVAVCCGARPAENFVLAGQPLGDTTWSAASARLADDVLVRALGRLGPAFLWHLAKERGCDSLSPKDGYNNLCEFCEEVTANRSAVRSLRAASEEIEVALRSVERFASLAGTDSTGE